MDGSSNNMKFYNSSGSLFMFLDDNVYTNGGVDYAGIRITHDTGIIQMFDTGYTTGLRMEPDGMNYTGVPGTTHYKSTMAWNASSSNNLYSFQAYAINSGSGDAYGMYISAGSAAKPSGGDWASASDSRVKTVGDNYTTGLSDLIQLEPKHYKYNGKADGAPNDGVDYVGLIAQEAEIVIPSLVSKSKHEIDDVEVDDFRMMDTSELQYALINAVKELNTRLTALEG